MSCEEKHDCGHCPFCIIEEMEGALRVFAALGQLKPGADPVPVARHLIAKAERALERVRKLRS